MAENRSFDATTPQANRAAEPGLGAGRKKLNVRRGPGRAAPAMGEGDNPQEDWGDPADEGATYSANHLRRPVKTEAERGQGKKTRTARKDQISRRG
jgi:hypothetical protein